MQPFTAIKTKQWTEFQGSLQRLGTLGVEVPEFFSDRRLTEFYRDVSARALGAMWDFNEKKHEELDDITQSDLKQIIEELIEKSGVAYDTEVQQVLTNAQGSFSGNLPEHMPTVCIGVFKAMGVDLGFDHLPSSESWQHAGLLYQLRCLCEGSFI